jgi:hypothetical protein
MIYNDPHAAGDQINVSGSASVVLTPPSSGTYAGLSLFQNRSSTVPLLFGGGSSSAIQGTVYAAAARVHVSGGSDVTIGSQYISYDLTVTGGSNLTIDRGGANVARKRDVRLVE